MTRLEQIEKLREKANVTYEEAKDALDAANGDLLDALILLEKQGKVEPPSGGGYYTSAKTSEATDEKEGATDDKHGRIGDNITDILDRIGRFCVRLINKGNAITLEVLKGDDSKVKIPLTVLALLVIFAPYISLPLIVIGLVMGYRYRFNEVDATEDEV